MTYLSEEQYKTQLEIAKRKNQSEKRKQKLKAEKNKYRQKKLPSTSKLVLLGAVILSLEIIIFSEYAMIKTGDLNGLYAVVGIAATLASVVLGYYFKSKSENTEGGIIYETALRTLEDTQDITPDERLYDENEISG